MKNAVVKSLYESFNKPLNESYEYWTEEDWAKKLKEVCHLNKEEADDLLHDLNNLRGDEWLEIVKDNCDDEELLIAFKEFIGANDIWEDEFDESLDEAIKTVDRYKLTDRFWKYFDASVKGMGLIDNLSVLTGKSRDDILSLNTKDAWEKFPKDGFLGYFSTDDIKKAVYEYEGRIPHSSLKRSSDEVLKEDYNSDLETARKIQKYLDDNDLWCDVSVHDGIVSVEINWGDWKHDHAYCKELMSDLGYVLVGKEITEEDGSDTFSAIHTYEKMDVIEEK